MKNAIRQRAQELGFDDCRFTTAAPPASAEKFQYWLAQKQNGEMLWLERNAEKRVEPQQVLAGAKSVIVLATSYEISNLKFQIPNPQSGVVASYARFAYYHDILG